MVATKHTSPPWTVEPRWDAVIQGFSPPTMYEVVFLDHLIAEVTSESDADLIAAAPELLERLERAYAQLCSHPEWCEANHPTLTPEHDGIRAAIAKARGET